MCSHTCTARPHPSPPLRFYSCYVCVPCALIARPHAMLPQMRKNMSAIRSRSRRNPSHWNGLCILEFSVILCSNASNCRRSFIVTVVSLSIWCVLSTYKSIIAHQQQQQHTHDVSFACRTLSHSLSRLPCHLELVWFGSVRWFIVVVVDCLCSLCYRLRLVGNIHSARIVVQKSNFFVTVSCRTKNFFYVRSYTLQLLFNFAKDYTHYRSYKHRFTSKFR